MTARPAVAPWQRQPSQRLKPIERAAPAVGGGSAPKRIGTRFEYAIKLQLERRGYFVMRSYSSKGPVDLLAIGKDRPPLFIQAKRTGLISSTEWNTVWSLATEHGAWPVLAMRESPNTTSYFRLDAPREFRKRARPMTRFDPKDCRELLPPPTLLDKVAL
jgi:Holliday junction resolvase